MIQNIFNMRHFYFVKKLFISTTLSLDNQFSKKTRQHFPLFCWHSSDVTELGLCSITFNSKWSTHKKKCSVHHELSYVSSNADRWPWRGQNLSTQSPSAILSNMFTWQSSLKTYHISAKKRFRYLMHAILVRDDPVR